MPFTDDQKKEIGALYNWTCAHESCGKNFFEGFMIEFHHLVPTSDGGNDSEDNCVPLCLEHHARWHNDLDMTHSASLIDGRLKQTHGRTRKWLAKRKEG